MALDLSRMGFPVNAEIQRDPCLLGRRRRQRSEPRNKKDDENGC